VLLVAGCAVLLLCGLGNPLGGGRSFIAFGQHYAINVVTAEQLTIDPCTQYESIVARDFGEAATVRQAWQANPCAFLWHLAYNVSRTPEAVADLVEPRLDLASKARRLLIVGVLGVVFLGAVGFGRRLVRGEQPNEGKHRLGVALVMLTLVLVPTAVSALVVAPELRYLMGVVLFLIALVVAGLGALPRLRLVTERLERPWVLVGLFVVLLAVTPNRAHGWNVQALLGRQPPVLTPALPDQRIVTALRQLPLERSSSALVCAARVHSFYARLPTHYWALTAKTGPFWDFVRQANIGIVVVDPFLLNCPSYRDDAQFQEFVTGERTGDFAFFDVAGLPVRIAVRRDLLRASRVQVARSARRRE
jgi:hypothetical protein